MDEYIVTVRLTNGDSQIRTLNMAETKEMLEDFFSPESLITTFVINKKSPVSLRERAAAKRSRR